MIVQSEKYLFLKQMLSNKMLMFCQNDLELPWSKILSRLVITLTRILRIQQRQKTMSPFWWFFWRYHQIVFWIYRSYSKIVITLSYLDDLDSFSWEDSPDSHREKKGRGKTSSAWQEIFRSSLEVTTCFNFGPDPVSANNSFFYFLDVICNNSYQILWDQEICEDLERMWRPDIEKSLENYFFVN